MACLAVSGRWLVFALADTKRQADRRKAKDESLRGQALAHHKGKRARKGHKVAGFNEALRVAG